VFRTGRVLPVRGAVPAVEAEITGPEQTGVSGKWRATRVQEFELTFDLDSRLIIALTSIPKRTGGASGLREANNQPVEKRVGFEWRCCAGRRNGIGEIDASWGQAV
jgi:hypothetical protein